MRDSRPGSFRQRSCQPQLTEDWRVVEMQYVYRKKAYCRTRLYQHPFLRPSTSKYGKRQSSVANPPQQIFDLPGTPGGRQLLCLKEPGRSIRNGTFIKLWALVCRRYDGGGTPFVIPRERDPSFARLHQGYALVAIFAAIVYNNNEIIL